MQDIERINRIKVNDEFIVDLVHIGEIDSFKSSKTNEVFNIFNYYDNGFSQKDLSIWTDDKI